MKRIIFIMISIVFIIISCEDNIFEQKPLDKILENSIWKDPVLMRAYLTNLYSRMLFSSRFGEETNLDSKTDIATTRGGNQNAITQGTMSKTNDAIPYWDYSLIRDVNIFINRIGNTSIVQTQKNQMEGEARVLRAMIYFEMQRRYGGVPLVDIPLDPYGTIDKKYTRRSTEEAIADFINADLTAAIDLLTENNKPLGQINKWTAYAVKARANLWTASIAKYGTVQLDGLIGIPSGRTDEFYTKASAAADSVILSGKYSLYNKDTDKSENYRKLFIDENNGETILCKKYDGVTILHSWNGSHLPPSFPFSWYSTENPLYDYILACENIDGSPDQPLIGSEYLYDNAYQAFEKKDPRIKAIVFFNNDIFDGHTVESYEGIDPGPVPNPSAILNAVGQYYLGMKQVGTDARLGPADRVSKTGFYIKKFIPDVKSAYNKNPWIEFRLAEMYLTKAEAEFELGNLQASATALNATRSRAGISLVDAGTITLNHVRTERMSELAWEQHRWWDLRRWRIAEDVLNLRTFKGLRPIFHYQTGKIYYLPVVGEPFARTFREEHYYNPITDSRISNNPDLVENPQY